MVRLALVVRLVPVIQMDLLHRQSLEYQVHPVFQVALLVLQVGRLVQVAPDLQLALLGRYHPLPPLAPLVRLVRLVQVLLLHRWNQGFRLVQLALLAPLHRWHPQVLGLRVVPVRLVDRGHLEAQLLVPVVPVVRVALLPARQVPLDP